ncbi:MAG: gamma-glutamyl hercynylcysteine S-oxide synthase [Acidobacteriota bacterium]|jgi:iron(II)-dependent oxidoreductase|nr:gamma-glutamyl hercynylcysteine S-oxide synthase [Acidobacteriota bacterium]
MNEQAEQIASMFAQAREETLHLFDLATERELRRSPGFGYRPLMWHLAHIGVFEAYWLVQKLGGRPAPDELYERVFDPIRTPREESKDLPSRREMEDYLRRVRSGVDECLACHDFDSVDPLARGGYLFHLVLEHEWQHQETLLYLFQLLDPSKKTRPVEPSRGAFEESTTDARGMVSVPAGSFMMGAVWDSFAYDNERPAREVFVPDFRIARAPVTNGEYARFIEEGGYERRECWGEEGWRWREKESWQCPLYWRREGAKGGWVERRMFDECALRLDHPVAGISWYEAEAYAVFAGKRLPTEAEWEKAASWDEARSAKRRYAWGDDEPDDVRCNFAQHFWGTTPVGAFPEGASAYGCLDMTGNVWEWTADAFDAFRGFEPFPYPEYSEVWFDGDHRVLKGGSWATRPTVLRTSFRNFFRRHFRIAFAGLRLAEDA